MKQYRRSCFLFALILTAWAASTAAIAQPAPARFRGKLLRTEIRKTVIKPTFICTLVKNTSPFVTFEFREQNELTHTEVNIYQEMQEILKEKNADGLDVGVEFAPVPGKFIEGEETERTEIQIKGPLINEPFNIQGKKYITDNTGKIIDYDQDILGAFDAINTRSFDLGIFHASLGEQRLTLTRDLIKRQTPELPGKGMPSQYDILEAFGLNFTQQMQCGRDGLEVKVTVNGEGKAGNRVAIIVDVSNSGSKPVSNLIARSFSRHPELNGKLFYFGLVGTAQFTRYVTIPATADPSQQCYLSIAFWDILGAIPEKRQDLCLTSPTQ